MAPIKFEEDMRDTLEKRSIQPSKNAWTTLASNLDTQEKRRNKKTFWWSGIAASIIGIIWIVTTVFNNNAEIIEPKIVDTQIIIEETPTQIIEENTNNNDVILIEEEDILPKPKETEIASTEAIEKSIKIEKAIIREEPIVEEELVAVQAEESTSILTDEEQKVAKVVAQIVELQSQNESVTDAEIDALLFKAQQEINMKKNKNIETSTVSAYALLMDVEQELDPSFREKVFDLLKENYNTVKNAVAQRND